MKILTAIDKFMNEQLIRRNSSATIDYYRIALDKFVVFVGSDLEHHELTLELYKAYTLHLLYDTELRSVSVNSYLRALRSFYNYLIDEELLPDFSRKLRLVKQDKTLIRPLSDAEASKLLGCFEEDTVLGLRNKCIVVLMLDSGLRLSEVTRLQLGDVFLDSNYILVNGKGSKQRIVPIGQNCKRLLSTYIATVRTHARSSAPLFVSKYNEKPITQNAIHCFFEDLKKQLGIPRLYPHLLRHTFATMYIIDGGNLETLRVILGHSTIAITQIYLHLAANYQLAYQSHQSHLDLLNKNTKPHSKE